MTDQPTPSGEPTEPVPLPPTPEPPPVAMPGPEPLAPPPPVAPPAYQQPAAPPPYAQPAAPPPYAQPAAPPPMAPPPVYDWQRPAEHVGPAPGVRFAGFGARLVAYIVDILIVGVAVVVLSVVLAIVVAGFVSTGSDNTAGVTVTVLLWVVVLFAVMIGYFPYFWARDGQTPGMRMLRIRVVRDRDGGPVTGGQAVLRLIGYWVSGAVFYLGYIWIFIDGRRRGWHDLIAGTCVIEA